MMRETECSACADHPGQNEHWPHVPCESCGGSGRVRLSLIDLVREHVRHDPFLSDGIRTDNNLVPDADVGGYVDWYLKGLTALELLAVVSETMEEDR